MRICPQPARPYRKAFHSRCTHGTDLRLHHLPAPRETHSEPAPYTDRCPKLRPRSWRKPALKSAASREGCELSPVRYVRRHPRSLGASDAAPLRGHHNWLAPHETSERRTRRAGAAVAHDDSPATGQRPQWGSMTSLHHLVCRCRNTTADGTLHVKRVDLPVLSGRCIERAFHCQETAGRAQVHVP